MKNDDGGSMGPEKGWDCPQPSGLSEHTRIGQEAPCWQGGQGKEGRRKEGMEETGTAREGQLGKDRLFVCEGPALWS